MNPSPGPIHRIQPFPQQANTDFAEKIGVPGQDGAYWLSPATEPPEAPRTRQRPVLTPDAEAAAGYPSHVVVKPPVTLMSLGWILLVLFGIKALLK